MIAKQSQIYE